MVEVTYGPMQLLVVGFKNPDFHGKIRETIGSVMEAGVIRLIDARFIWKDANGDIEILKATQLTEEEQKRFGAAISALIGLGPGGEEKVRAGAEARAMAAAQRIFGVTRENVHKIVDDIPNGSAAAIFLIEHLWAKDLEQALYDANIYPIAEGLIMPDTLMMAGTELRKAVEAAGSEERKRSVAAPAR